MATVRSDKFYLSILTAYSLTIAVFYAASFFPEARLWGVNWFGSFDRYGSLILLVAGSLVPFVLTYVEFTGEPSADNRSFPLTAGGTVILFALLFYFFRARTHFLGDGYQVLDWLRSGGISDKPWAAGLQTVQAWWYDIAKNFSSEPALLSSQLLSYISGVIFVWGAAVAAARLFDRNREQVLFLLGLCSGGHMLLYFGYVENYPLFVTVVGLFSLTGLAVARRKVRRVWLLIPLALAVTLHIFCVALIPAAVYLLLRETALGRQLAAWSPGVRWSGAAVGLALAGAAFVYAYMQNYFFRFTIVPFVDGPLVVESYTMFSAAHLLDYGNLLWQHAPAFALFVTVLFFVPVRSLAARPDYRFLILLLTPALIMVFIFQPGLAMPRDWDLFSFPAIPLVLLGFYTILDNRERLTGYVPMSVLAVALGFMLLLPRVATQVIPEIGIAVFERMAALDSTRNHAGRFILIDYYEKKGDSANVERMRRLCRAEYPQERWYEEARILTEQRQLVAAVEKLRDAVNFDPSYGHAWAGLGLYHYNDRRYDSALACWQIASAVTPFNADHLRQLGLGYSATGDTGRAEDCWRRAAALDTSDIASQMYLVELFREQERADEYRALLMELAARPDCPLGILVEYADYCAFIGDLEAAAAGFRRALGMGLDTAFVLSRQKQYPRLQALEN